MKGKDLFALMPCPVKVAIEEEFQEYIDEIEKKNNCKYDYIIEANANKNLANHNFIDDYKSIEDMPDIIISAGINDFYGRDFYDKYIAKGLFSGKRSNEYYTNISEDFGKDPSKSYNIIALNVLVMVLDLTKIGDRKIPNGFKDILDAEFENSVAIRAEKNKFCETTLLTVFKEYGIDGIRNLRRSVIKGYHPSEMVQLAGKNLECAPTISIMPYFYAKTIQNQNKIKIIWPEEGAIVSPITMLVKKESEDRLEKIVDFFMGDECGKLFSNVNFITLSRNVDSKIPKEAKYYWPGWDYIRENDIKYIVGNLNKEFCR